MPEYKGDDDESANGIIDLLRNIIGQNHFSKMSELTSYLDEWVDLYLKQNSTPNSANSKKIHQVIMGIPIFTKELKFHKLEIPSIMTIKFTRGFDKVAKKIKLSEKEKELILDQIWYFWGWILVKKQNNYRVLMQIELEQLSKSLKTKIKKDIQKTFKESLPQKPSRVPLIVKNHLLKKINTEIDQAINDIANLAKNDHISKDIHKYYKKGRPNSEAFIQFLIEVKKIIQSNDKYMDRLLPLMLDLQKLSPDLFGDITINQNNLRVLISKEINKTS